MSRYYDPVTHRFVNADGYFQSGGNILDTIQQEDLSEKRQRTVQRRIMPTAFGTTLNTDMI